MRNPVAPHKLNSEVVNKVITNLIKGGRSVDIMKAVEEGKELISFGHMFPTSSEVAAWFSSVIWNAGLVK